MFRVLQRKDTELDGFANSKLRDERERSRDERRSVGLECALVNEHKRGPAC